MKRIPWNKGLRRAFVKCPICGKQRYHQGKSNFQRCRKCYANTLRGKRVSPQTEFKKGNISWSKLNSDKMPRGKRNCNWKGNNVGYFSLHNWVKRNYKWENFCNVCKSKKRLTLASKNYNYSRQKEDWWILCSGCNTRYDRQNGWGEATRRFLL